MVVELYADWAQGRRDRPHGAAPLAFGRIRSFFRAVASALHGEGFHDAASIMERSGNGTTQQRENGRFGPIITGFEGDWRGAASEPERLRDDEAIGALSHPDIDSIALVRGRQGTRRSDGYGLAKLIAWHPEVLVDLQGRLDRMSVTSRSENRIQLESESDRAGIRLDWDGQSGAWLIRVYEKDAPRLAEKFTGTLADLWGGMAPQPRRGNTNMDAGGGPVKEPRDMTALRNAIQSGRSQAAGLVSREFWQKSPQCSRTG